MRANEMRKPFEILLVEDNRGDVDLTKESLKEGKIPHQLNIVPDGEEAMNFLRRKGKYSGAPTPDLVLLDLNLPKRDGFEVLRAIRSRPSLVGVPVGIFTSSEAAADKGRIAVLRAERYIHKPPDLNDFMEQVGGAITDILRSSKDREL